MRSGPGASAAPASMSSSGNPRRRTTRCSALDNVILGSHNLAHCDGMVAAATRDAAFAVMALARGRAPKGPVNPQVLTHGRLRGLAPPS